MMIKDYDSEKIWPRIQGFCIKFKRKLTQKQVIHVEIDRDTAYKFK